MKNGIMKVIQISDTHLFANDTDNIYGVQSNIKFNEVVERMLYQDYHDTNMIFLTGDISQDETVQSYQKITDKLSNLNIPIYWIPGNHDNIHQMESVFSNTKNFISTRHLILPNWHFIFLNTKLNGADEGYLARSELENLKEELTLTDDKNVTIIMHHHPEKIGTPLIDNFILKNREKFWEIVNKKIVKLIICGHVHGDYCFKHNNTMIEASPATCFQWEKGAVNLNIDMKIGYKIIYFDQNCYKTITKLW